MNFLLPWAKAKWNLIYFPFSVKNNILYIFYVLHNATLKSTNTTQYERDLIMFNFILILFSQPLKINWLFFSIYWMLSITPSDWIMITTIPIVLVKWMEGDRMEWRKRNNFFRLWMEKRRLFSHFGSAIILLWGHFSLHAQKLVCWMRAKVFFTTIATILLQYDTFKENISIQWSTVWMCGRWTMAHIYKIYTARAKLTGEDMKPV